MPDDNEKRALEAIAAINAGANPAAEAFSLSNEFSDRQVARLRTWLRTWLRTLFRKDR